MKNSIIIIAVLIMTSFAATAANGGKDYVITKDGISYYSKVKIGSDTGFITCYTEKGEKVKIEKEKVLAFNREGALFEKKQVIINNKECNNCDFMQVVSTYKDLKICKYMVKDTNGNYAEKLFVFRNNTYLTCITKENLNQVLALLK